MRKLTSEFNHLFLGPGTASSVHIILLLALCGVLYFPYLGAVPFFDKGEPREALAVQDIVQRGEWLFPLKRATAIPSKPPLFHWSAALTYQATGKLNESTIRFPSALYATLGVLLVYGLGRKLFGAETGLLGGALLATTMLYGNLALNARVDMTLCFFVTASLVLFYFLYRGFLTNPFCYFLFYAIVGVGTLAKGPLGILLPGLVIASFLSLKRRWDLFGKFCFHPGVLLTLALALGWYGLAVTRGGEGFVDRQILKENLERFFGGSGHSHPIYYYLPYLFSQGLPWSLFLPFLLWDFFKRGSPARHDGAQFLLLWCGAMFVFFSLSLGKRPVYLLPLYPALALLTALWLNEQMEAVGIRRLLYRMLAALAAFLAAVLLVIASGSLWNHDPGWFFSPLEGLLKPKDRANLLAVKDGLRSFGWPFTVAAGLSGILWLAAAQSLWQSRLRAAARRLVSLSVLSAFISWSMILPAIAATRSYREFMREVNRRVPPSDKLYLFGGFNSDSVIFYRGAPIDALDQPAEQVAAAVGTDGLYVIMDQQAWAQIERLRPDLPPPLLKSRGAGPEGDAPIFLVQAGGLSSGK